MGSGFQMIGGRPSLDHLIVESPAINAQLDPFTIDQLSI
jgi:hypothetical protein